MTQPNADFVQTPFSTSNSLLAGSTNLAIFPGQPVLALVVVKDSHTNQVVSWRTQEIGTVAAYIDILQTLNPNTFNTREENCR